MKKYIVIAILLIAPAVYADPFLVCDIPPVDEQVTEYEVFQDGVSLGKTPAPLHFDLEGITPDKYNFTATACNSWGCSELSDPYVSPLSATKPLNTNMTP